VKILIDADALPAPARDILLRAAQRLQIPAEFFANKNLKLPTCDLISFELVEAGFDEADARIVEQTTKGDLVVTADIPLAAQIVDKGAMAVDPRGQLYNESNIKERLFVRDLMDTLRKSGITTSGPPPYSNKNRREFASLLDKILTRKLNESE
jgi:uncharacterized protein YaiI (UPF0178 family)